MIRGNLNYRPHGPRDAFTIVELLVVIGIIAIILTVAIPGLSGILAQVRADAATKNVSSMINRAYYTAAADSNLTAIRIFPGKWDYSPTAEPNQAANRQHMALYSFRSEYRNPATGTLVAPQNPLGQFVEFFARLPGSDSVILPADAWSVPVESLTGGVEGQRLLTGRLETFGLNPVDEPNFMDSEDFLLVFDPQNGLRTDSGWRMNVPTRYIVKAYDPNAPSGGPAERIGSFNRGDQSDRLTRVGFGGLSFYRRDAYRALDRSPTQPATAAARQTWLLRNSRSFYVSRLGGGLVEAASN